MRVGAVGRRDHVILIGIAIVDMGHQDARSSKARSRLPLAMCLGVMPLLTCDIRNKWRTHMI
eukprot:744188-Pleurochrysis_carterae.AAC.1